MMLKEDPQRSLPGVPFSYKYRNSATRRVATVRCEYRQNIVFHTVKKSVLLDNVVEQLYLSQYNVWLRTVRPGDRGLIPGRGKRFFL